MPHVTSACRLLPSGADGKRDVRVLSLEPRSLSDVADSFVAISEAATGSADLGKRLSASFLADVSAIASLCAAGSNDAAARPRRLRCVMLEWTDPLFDGGHWVPDMMAAAGLHPPTRSPGADSTMIQPEARARERALCSSPSLLAAAHCAQRLSADPTLMAQSCGPCLRPLSFRRRQKRRFFQGRRIRWPHPHRQCMYQARSFSTPTQPAVPAGPRSLQSGLLGGWLLRVRSLPQRVGRRGSLGETLVQSAEMRPGRASLRCQRQQARGGADCTLGHSSCSASLASACDAAALRRSSHITHVKVPAALHGCLRQTRSTRLPKMAFLVSCQRCYTS